MNGVDSLSQWGGLYLPENLDLNTISWSFFLWSRVVPGPISQLTACSCTVKLLPFFFCDLAIDVTYLKVCFKPQIMSALHLTAATGEFYGGHSLVHGKRDLLCFAVH